MVGEGCASRYGSTSKRLPEEARRAHHCPKGRESRTDPLPFPYKRAFQGTAGRSNHRLPGPEPAAAVLVDERHAPAVQVLVASIPGGPA
jgi:hypothetical protein